MRKEIKEVIYYQYNELDDRAKERAREWYRQSSSSDDWYTSVYEEAERIGLKIIAFDIDRGAYVQAKFVKNAYDCAKFIRAEHGESEATYKQADLYIKALDTITRKEAESDEIESYNGDDDIEELNKQFLKDLQEEYRIMLRNECEYINSDEYIEEAIKINEYEFNGEGGII